MTFARAKKYCSQMSTDIINNTYVRVSNLRSGLISCEESCPLLFVVGKNVLVDPFNQQSLSANGRVEPFESQIPKERGREGVSNIKFTNVSAEQWKPRTGAHITEL